MLVAEEEKEHESSIANDITEKFASDAQRRGFFKHKDKKKKVTETDRVTIADPRVKSGTTVIDITGINTGARKEVTLTVSASGATT